MASRRMFSRDVVESDDFLDLSVEAQTLYFHLSMYADDDGLLNCVKRISQTIGIGKTAVDELVASGFLLEFDSGVYAVTDWKISNYIQKDRYHPTKFTAEFKQIQQDCNCRYSVVSIAETNRIQDVHKMDTETRLGKARIEPGKNSVESDKCSIAPPAEERKGGAGERETPEVHEILKSFDEGPDFETKKREAMNLLMRRE